MRRAAFLALLLLPFALLPGCARRAAQAPPAAASPVPSASPGKTVPPASGGEAERKVELPDDVTAASFDQLWFVSRQWQVGSYIEIVARARAELRRRGKSVLADVMKQFPIDGGLEQRAFVDYFRSLGDDAVEPLLSLVASKDARKRLDALSLIHALHLKAAVPALKKYERDPDIGAPLRRVLAYLGDRSVAPLLIEDYRKASGLLAMRVLSALQALKDPALVPFFTEECGAVPVTLRRLAQNSLVAIGEPAVPGIVKALPGSPPLRYRTLLEALGRIGSPQAVVLLVGETDPRVNPDWRIRFSAIRALQFCKLDDARKKTLRARLAAEPNVFCRRELARLLQEEIRWKEPPPKTAK